VAETALGRRIRQLRGKRTLKEINQGAKVGVSKLSKLERGDEDNPQYETLVRVARGLDVPLATLFDESRPEEGSGHAERPSEGSPILETFLARLDAEAPAEDSVRGDILKAIAALNRALRREADTGAPPAQAPKAGR
jgi:transcriptional regulator with XRE-family HTH domain